MDGSELEIGDWEVVRGELNRRERHLLILLSKSTIGVSAVSSTRTRCNIRSRIKGDFVAVADEQPLASEPVVNRDRDTRSGEAPYPFGRCCLIPEDLAELCKAQTGRMLGTSEP